MGRDEGCMEGKKRGLRKGFLKRAVLELRPEAREALYDCVWLVYINMS